jgi:glutamine synthetase
MTPKEVIALAEENEARVVDVKFCDLFGSWQHFSMPAQTLSEEMFEDGLGFDGSSIRGFQKINESDMLLIPDPATAIMDPFTEIPTLSILCDIQDPITRDPYSRDPRYTAKKAVQYLQVHGIADTAFFGAEAEFYIFNEVPLRLTRRTPVYHPRGLDEGIGTRARDRDEQAEPGLQDPLQGRLLPGDALGPVQDLRTEMMLTMLDVGIDVEVQHHEVGTAGQAEIDLKFAPLVKHADDLMLYKYIIKNVAFQNGYTATFMPKPAVPGQRVGHAHARFVLERRPDDDVRRDGLRAAVRASRLLHRRPASARARAARVLRPDHQLVPPLVPGYEAPINLVYSNRNRSACCRIPAYSKSPKAKRVEFRAPDPSANPYLAFSAILMAGLDGIQNKIQPPAPVDKDIYEMDRSSSTRSASSRRPAASRLAQRARGRTTSSCSRAACSPAT